MDDGVYSYTHGSDGSVYPIFPAPENTLPVGQTSSQINTTLASDGCALPQQCQPLLYEERMSPFQWQTYHDVHTGSSPQQLVSHIPMVYLFQEVCMHILPVIMSMQRQVHGLVLVLVSCLNQQAPLGISESS